MRHSEMIGSFIRTGNYPMEADYVFSTEQELHDFYSLPLTEPILHKGWLKIVESDPDGKQALYWVVFDEATLKLKFEKLITANSINELLERLSELEQRLNQEIQDRTEADNIIYGDNKDNIPNDLDSISELAAAIVDLRERVNNLDNQVILLKNNDKAITGSPNDEIVEYLKTLDYQNLTQISEILKKFFKERDPHDEKVNTLLELQDFLTGYTDLDKLKDILNKLWEKIMGDPMPTEEFRTLRGVLDYVLNLESNHNNLLKEVDQIQIGVGLSGDGSYNADRETHFLKNATSVMNALKILDSLINEAINNVNIQVEDTNTVDLNLVKEVNRTTLSALVKISTDNGNGIIAKDNGLYHKIDTEYEDGILTLKVNDNVISQHNIGLSYIGVKQAYYDSGTEHIVMEFNKEGGASDIIRIPATNLIREWVVDNNGPSDVVVLTKIEKYGGEADTLSADVRLFRSKDNILVKESNHLYVKGTADNITWGDVKVSELLDGLKQKVEDLDLTPIKNDITNLKAKDAELQLAVNEAERKSENAALKADETKSLVDNIKEAISNHEKRLDNPHNVTKEQIGLGNVENLSPQDMPISNSVQLVLNNKADINDINWIILE